MDQHEDAHRTHPFVAVLLPTDISRLGNTLAALAISWFVLSMTGSATSTAITVAVGTVPVLIAETFDGAPNLLFFNPMSCAISDHPRDQTMSGIWSLKRHWGNQNCVLPW